MALLRGLVTRLPKCRSMSVPPIPMVVPSSTLSHNHRPRHIWKISDLDRGEIEKILECALAMKHNPDLFDTVMQHRTAVILLDRPSIRTRLSFEVALFQLGGYASTVRSWDLPKDRNFQTLDEAGALFSSFADMVVSGMTRSIDLKLLAKNCHIPIINAEDAMGNPCQGWQY